MTDSDYTFHPLEFKKLPAKMNDPFTYKLTPALRKAMTNLDDWIKERPTLKTELCRGKMLGVLIVRHKDGRTGYLAAFSGQIFSSNTYEGFVPPVFDILSPDSYFRTGEAELTLINRAIRNTESSRQYFAAKRKAEEARAKADTTISEFKAMMKAAKEDRDTKRKAGTLTAAEEKELQNQSANLKTQLKRLTQQAEAEYKEQSREFDEIAEMISALKVRRAAQSEALQTRIFRDFKFRNTAGQTKDLIEIFGNEALPPAGAGECCAPRLLQYAFVNGYTPIAIAEYWIGGSPEGKIRHSGTYYHACRSKCLPILSFMLEGMSVEQQRTKVITAEEETIRTIYRDSDILVVSKPSGMASVKGKEVEYSLEEWVQKTIPEANGPIVVHRLDQDTSGLMVFALNKDAHKKLQQQFTDHTVAKTYIAVVGGKVDAVEGKISLPLSPDLENRPMQKVDLVNGLEAITTYKRLSCERTKTRLEVHPFTGRTHQIRVHLAAHSGLNRPIVGDRLYGTKKGESRLLLHASALTFVHPSTGEAITFRDEPPF